MTELFLDNQRAIPKEGSSFKYTASNPFFTKSASYTLDIELPLDIEDNRKIFGWLDRLDVSKQPRSLDARLVVDNINVLVGIANITQTTDTSVRVQLLGEASAYNYRNRLDKLYIDKLILPDFNQYISIAGGNIWSVPLGIFKDITSCQNSVYGHKYPFVAYPVRNSSADTVLNNIIYCKKNGSVTMKCTITYEVDDFNDHNMNMSHYIAFQPYLWWVCKNIAQASGYDLEDSDNALLQDSFLRKIFIANANTYTALSRMLPHWSVNEWWSQVENAFGLVSIIDYANKRMSLVKRAEYFNDSSNVVEISDVVNEFTAEIEESIADISISNVEFSDFEAGKEDILSDYIVNNATYNTSFANLAALLQWGKTADFSFYKNTIFKCADGRHYIYVENSLSSPGFIEVDMFRARNVSESAENISLKFVPAHYAKHNVKVFNMPPTGLISPISKDAYLGDFEIDIIEKPDVSELFNNGSVIESIEDVLSGDEEEVSDSHSELPDVIYLAIENESNPNRFTPVITKPNGSSESLGSAIEYPRPFLRERAQARLSDAQPSIADHPYSLSLIPIQSQINLASVSLNGMQPINTNAKHCIQFVADRIPNADSIFLIRNKKFVCEKLEVSITPNGMDKLITGYFYET